MGPLSRLAETAKNAQSGGFQQERTPHFAHLDAHTFARHDGSSSHCRQCRTSRGRRHHRAVAQATDRNRGRNCQSLFSNMPTIRRFCDKAGAQVSSTNAGTSDPADWACRGAASVRTRRHRNTISGIAEGSWGVSPHGSQSIMQIPAPSASAKITNNYGGVTQHFDLPQHDTGDDAADFGWRRQGMNENGSRRARSALPICNGVAGYAVCALRGCLFD